MGNWLKIIAYIRAYSVIALYMSLSLFALLLVFANFKFWPYTAKNTSFILILLQVLSGIGSTYSGFYYVAVMNKKIQKNIFSIKIDQFLYIPHLLAMSLCLFLSSIIFS